ncbi:MAG TPA: ATP-binding cassette domain-containing protein, partial [Acidilobales archaeon]|nr:ATP-binding cassette domain-containing protein [Acidilobales archaeon]
VMEIADRIVVLRKGRVVGRLKREEANPRLLAKLMVGREVFLEINKPPANVGKVVLEVKDLKALSDKGVLALKGISFRIREGEILGVAGVAGNGQKELAEVLYGLRKPLSGKIYFLGKDITNVSIAERIRLGISLIPEERLKFGIVGEFPVADNFIIEIVDNEPFSVKVPFISALGVKILNHKAILDYAKKLIGKYRIVTPSPNVKARTLSGGNIQRLMVAREFERRPRLIIAEEPTAGLDVAATEYVRNLLVEMRSKGHAILLISSDLSEVLSLSDKVMVMYEGEIVGVFRPGELSIEEVGLLMAGAKKMPKEEVMRRW